MVIQDASCEGKVFIIKYIEITCYSERETALVFRIEDNKLITLWGVDNLPLEVEEWNDNDVLEFLIQLGVDEVFVPPIETTQFMDLDLGVYPSFPEQVYVGSDRQDYFGFLIFDPYNDFCQQIEENGISVVFL